MAQQFPTSAQVIYDTLAADSTFMSFLGSYEFRAGQSVPAISIVTPGRDLPAVKKVTGVEVIIHDAADVRRLDYVTTSSDVIVDWKVFLFAGNLRPG